MKVVWGKFGTGVDLIVCAISSYWWVSLWVNEWHSSLRIQTKKGLYKP